MFKNIICFLIAFTSFQLLAQNNDNESFEINDSIQDPIKRISLGLKIGIPNIIGGSIEGVLPVFNNRMAPYANISGFKFDVDDIGLKLSYLEFGSKIYFNNDGNGFFLGVGASKFSSALKFSNLDLESGQGSGEVDLDINTFIIKLGAKTGGRIYFSFELGYGIGSIPDNLVFNATSSNGIKESVTENIPPIPGITKSGMLIGNVGFGISF
jgi:hypothetical protein